MPRSALGMDGTTDDLPVHMKRARGQDRTWTARSRCREPNILADLTRYAIPIDEPIERRRAWTVDSSDGRVTVAGRIVDAVEVVKACVSVCRACPVQGDCITYAVKVQEKCGTWAAPFEGVFWLQRNRTNLDDVLEAWEDNAVPVADSVDFLMTLG